MQQYGVHAFDVLGDPVRRRILELLADQHALDGAPVSSGVLADTIETEFGISRPAVSQHLRVLRDSGFASVQADGQRRLYSMEAAPLREIDAWLDRYRGFWAPRLDALDMELRRGRRAPATTRNKRSNDQGADR